MQRERRLQVLTQGHNSFDMSVEAVHDNVSRYLPEAGLHSEAIHSQSSLVMERGALQCKHASVLQNISVFSKHMSSSPVFSPSF